MMLASTETFFRALWCGFALGFVTHAIVMEVVRYVRERKDEEGKDEHDRD